MKKILLLIILIIFVNSCNNGSSDEICINTPEGLLIPLYKEDATLWNIVINLNAFHTTAIVNPDNGPGLAVDPFYQDVINKLILNGKTPIGYIYTNYGNRNIGDVKADIDKWLTFYPNIKGFFFDEVSDSIDKFSYYQEIYLYTKQKGNYLVFFNVGTFPAIEYFSIADNIVVYEGDATGFNKELCNLFPEKSSFIVYNADINIMIDLMRNSSCLYKYITDDTLPDPYDSLPSYIYEEANESKNINVCL